jgi:hypothetical protein
VEFFVTSHSKGKRDSFADAIAGLCVWQKSPFFVQVGGYDGITLDPLRAHIVEYDLAGLIVEPITSHFEKIQNLYKYSPNVKVFNCAIAEFDGDKKISRFKPNAIKQGILPPHFAGIVSFVMDDLFLDGGYLSKSCDTEETRSLLKELIEEISVRTCRFESVLNINFVSNIDILQINTEGYDLSILRTFDFKRWHPSIVHYAHDKLTPANQQAAIHLLQGHGYNLVPNNANMLAVRAPGIRVPQETTTALLGLGERLLGEGRQEDAAILAGHIAKFETLPPQSLLQRALYNEKLGLLLEALEDIYKIHKLTGSLEGFLEAGSEIIRKSVAQVQHLANIGKFEDASTYCMPLVNIMPGHIKLIELYAKLLLRLNRTEECEYFSEILFRDDPNSLMANTVLVDKARRNKDLPRWREHLTSIILNKESNTVAHGRMHEIVELLGLILTGVNIKIEDRLLAKEIVNQAKSLIPLSTALPTEDQEWFRHYWLIVRAIEEAEQLTPLPQSRATGPSICCSGTGKPLSLDDVKEKAQSVGAQSVLLVAADEKYFRLYARMFVLSALNIVDVGCLVIVHVIGGEGKLATLAQEIGINDDRLILTADNFDATAVKTISIAPPPDSIIKVPVAHFQSIRFDQADFLLSHLGLPVFVTDIDCVLLKGIAEVLDFQRGKDIVFNLNPICHTVGDFLTANLVLFYPTKLGKIYSATLREYLQISLAGTDVCRWIDQIGLLVARNHLIFQNMPLNVGYFQAEVDINNAMYGKLPKEPTRFFSLFQTFDLNSLKEKIREWEQALSVSPAPWPPSLVR